MDSAIVSHRCKSASARTDLGPYDRHILHPSLHLDTCDICLIAASRCNFFIELSLASISAFALHPSGLNVSLISARLAEFLRYWIVCYLEQPWATHVTVTLVHAATPFPWIPVATGQSTHWKQECWPHHLNFLFKMKKCENLIFGYYAHFSSENIHFLPSLKVKIPLIHFYLWEQALLRYRVQGI